MNLELFKPADSSDNLEEVAKRAFGDTPDSMVEDWFSFAEMKTAVESGRGVCVEAVSADDILLGFVYAQQESPINGREGKEKWVILITAIDPESAGKGVGSALLNEVERQAADKGAVKMFVYTNKDDERVINFYHKNNYSDAGWIKDYQYGEDNSAAFLLKHLRKQS